MIISIKDKGEGGLHHGDSSTASDAAQFLSGGVLLLGVDSDTPTHSVRNLKSQRKHLKKKKSSFVIDLLDKSPL